MTAFGGQTLTYDANGNLTNDGTNNYTWDARNHLNAISGGITASFQYDPFGRRALKTVNSATTQFLYDGLNPVQELDGSSPPNVTANLLTGTGIDEYFTRTDSAGARNFLTDMLGNTIAADSRARSRRNTATTRSATPPLAAPPAQLVSIHWPGKRRHGAGLLSREVLQAGPPTFHLRIRSVLRAGTSTNTVTSLIHP